MKVKRSGARSASYLDSPLRMERRAQRAPPRGDFSKEMFAGIRADHEPSAEREYERQANAVRVRPRQAVRMHACGKGPHAFAHAVSNLDDVLSGGAKDRGAQISVLIKLDFLAVHFGEHSLARADDPHFRGSTVEPSPGASDGEPALRYERDARFDEQPFEPGRRGLET